MDENLSYEPAQEAHRAELKREREEEARIETEKRREFGLQQRRKFEGDEGKGKKKQKKAAAAVGVQEEHQEGEINQQQELKQQQVPVQEEKDQGEEQTTTKAGPSASLAESGIVKIRASSNSLPFYHPVEAEGDPLNLAAMTEIERLRCPACHLFRSFHHFTTIFSSCFFKVRGLR